MEKKDSDTSLKRPTPNDSKVSKTNFELLMQILEPTPPRKAPNKSELRKLQSTNPEDFFQTFDSGRRGSGGFEIRSRNLKKKSSKVRQKDPSADELKPEKIKEIQNIYKCIRNKSENPVRDQAFIKKEIKNFRLLVTPITEKKSETFIESPKSLWTNLTPSPRTPQEHIIRIPNSYRRQKIVRHKKILKD